MVLLLHDIANKPHTTMNKMSTVTLLITYILNIALREKALNYILSACYQK